MYEVYSADNKLWKQLYIYHVSGQSRNDHFSHSDFGLVWRKGKECSVTFRGLKKNWVRVLLAGGWTSNTSGISDLYRADIEHIYIHTNTFGPSWLSVWLMILRVSYDASSIPFFYDFSSLILFIYFFSFLLYHLRHFKMHSICWWDRSWYNLSHVYLNNITYFIFFFCFFFFNK